MLQEPGKWDSGLGKIKKMVQQHPSLVYYASAEAYKTKYIIKIIYYKKGI